MRALVVAVLLTAFAMPAAFACTIAESRPPPPIINWPRAPEQLDASESVMEVERLRGVLEHPLGNPDIVIIHCGPYYSLYRVVRTLAGPRPFGDLVMLSGGYAIYDYPPQPSSEPIVVVGKLIEPPDNRRTRTELNVHRDVRLLQPRWPPPALASPEFSAPLN